MKNSVHSYLLRSAVNIKLQFVYIKNFKSSHMPTSIFSVFLGKFISKVYIVNEQFRKHELPFNMKLKTICVIALGHKI